jgi:PAS domain-containing protein
MRVISANQAFYDCFRVSPKEAEGQLLYDLGNRQWDIPKLRELLEAILPQRSRFRDFEVVHDFETIGQRTMLLNAREVVQDEGRERLILLAIEDVTD